VRRGQRSIRPHPIAFARIRRFCQPSTAGFRIKERRGAIKWTRPSCRSFAANAVRLQLHALAHNLRNFVRTLAMPKTAEPWSLTSLREKLIKIGAKVVSHGRCVTFQMAQVAVSRQLFADILMLNARLRAPPAPACPEDGVKCDRPTTGEVRLDERQATGCSLGREQPADLGRKRGWLRSNFIARRPDETEDHAQQTWNPGNVG
jgi:Transposase DDE domain group 1